MKIKHIIYTGFAALLLSGVVVAQEQPNVRQRADQLFERLEYYNAAQLYERLSQGGNPRTSDFERLAESYYLIGDYVLAENWYARAAQQADFSQHAHWQYGEVLKMNGRYAEAKNQLQAYQEKYGSTAATAFAIAGADSAQVWMASPTGHWLRNESGINTDLSEFGAYPTGEGILYAGEPKVVGNRSGMTGRSYLRVFSGSVEGESLIGHPVLLGDGLNDARYHVGPVISGTDGNTLYVTRTYPGKDTERFRKEGTRWHKANLELKVYTRDDDSHDWQESDFPYNNVQEYSLGHAALSDDGQTLYYASDMPGGHGGVDIWYSELQPDGTWGAPQNAGPTVNSEGDELFPSVHGDVLYWSSTGFAGMGGLDIFQARGSKQRFSNRQNLGHPLNSAADDFAYVVAYSDEASSRGYLSSNRQGGVGGDDIYSFGYTKPRITILLTGLTKNRETGELLPGSTVTLFRGDREIVAKKVSDGAAAAFEFELDRHTEYRLYGEKDKFFPDSLLIGAVNPTRDTTIRVELLLQPVFVVGTSFVLENIYYDFDKHNIRADAAEILDKVVAVMRDNPTLKIELSSHTDSRGSHRYNDGLSQRRATAAVEYIISRGIARDRLVAKGYGERRLVNHCSDGVPCNVDQHQANRRTEIEILEF